MLSNGVLLAVLLAARQAPAMNPATHAPAAPTGYSAPLDLRLPPSAARPAAMPTNRETPQRRPIRLEPRQSILEAGVASSREALIACQQGAYPGAAVAAYNVRASGTEAQPDHCHRF